jgi:hypothetical protein
MPAIKPFYKLLTKDGAQYFNERDDKNEWVKIKKKKKKKKKIYRCQ